MIALAGVPVNRAAFLDMIAFSEIGTELLPNTDDNRPYHDSACGWHAFQRIRRSLPQPEADYLRDNRILAAVETAQAQPWWPMVQDCDPRARAFIEILFNMGLAKFNEFTKAITAALQSDWQTCTAELLDSLWAHQVGARAETLASMVQSGSDPVSSP